MFLPARASETLLNSSASLSTFLQPMTTMGSSVAAATDLHSSTHSSTLLFSPLGSAPSRWMHTKDAPGMDSTRLAISATEVQPA